MSVTVVTTTNESSFAVASADGFALILDALGNHGQMRRELLTRAQDRLDTALRHAEDRSGEFTLVRQLQETIKLYERKGWDWE